MSDSLRVVFFGSSDYAVPSLRALAASRHDVIGVVTQPDAPAGRGRRPTPTPVARAAGELGLPMCRPSSLRDRDTMAWLRGCRPDVGVVLSYGRILPGEVLSLPPLGMVGVHPSLLPRHRGPTPVQWALKSNDAVTGVTTFQVVQAVDAGPIYLQQEERILPTDDAMTLQTRLADSGASVLMSTLDAMASGRLSAVPQDDRQATYTRKLVKEDGLLDWSRPVEELHNLVRALVPWPGAFAVLGGVRLGIWKTEPASCDDAQLGTHGDAVPVGTLVSDRGRLLARTGDGWLALEEVQPAGRCRMSGKAFLVGTRVRVGMRFDWPVKAGDEARKTVDGTREPGGDA